jgi:hypothetical protein
MLIYKMYRMDQKKGGGEGGLTVVLYISYSCGRKVDESEIYMDSIM